MGKLAVAIARENGPQGPEPPECPRWMRALLIAALVGVGVVAVDLFQAEAHAARARLVQHVLAQR